jgi:hypothetical protein
MKKCIVFPALLFITALLRNHQVVFWILKSMQRKVVQAEIFTEKIFFDPIRRTVINIF